MISDVKLASYQPLLVSKESYCAITVQYDDDYWLSTYTNNTVEITDGSIISKSVCGILISLIQNNYDVNIALRNLQFHNLQKEILQTFIETTGKVLVENCSFKFNKFRFTLHVLSMITITMSTTNTAMTFLNCKFYRNGDFRALIFVEQFRNDNTTCIDTPNIILKTCDFIDNTSPLLHYHSFTEEGFCMLNFIIRGPSFM